MVIDARQSTLTAVSYTHLDVYKRQGILNTRCDRLFVEFEFALGADDARVYRVTRSYMRSESGDALKARKCALVRIESGHEIVLSAEKPSDITQRVQQLLGLTMSDFVHSVDVYKRQRHRRALRAPSACRGPWPSSGPI